MHYRSVCRDGRSPERRHADKPTNPDLATRICCPDNLNGFGTTDRTAYAIQCRKDILAAVAERGSRIGTYRERVSTIVRTLSFFPVANWS